MKYVKLLPSVLVKRYRGWRATTFEENKSWYQRLAALGQNPRTMIISCCDSRLQISSLFDLEMGEVFTHQNIANLVPKYKPDDEQHGTSAAIEYAVRFLRVSNIIVMGHSNCGGIKGAHDMFADGATNDTKFLTPWLEQIRPAFELAKDTTKNGDDIINQMEKHSVLVSLENLMTFPFVQEAVENNQLTLHGLWNDIGEGLILQYNHQTHRFENA